MHADQARQALVTSIVGFASRIGAQVVAEGIEREEELQVLREAGVGLGQGYLLARPQPDLDSALSLPRPGAARAA